MAEVSISISRNPAWPRDTRLELWIGTEDAASLAASTPTGGRMVLAQDAWDLAGGQLDEEIGLGEGPLGEGGFGESEFAPARLAYTYTPAKACCRLPVGVSTVDGAGNRSGVLERVIRIDDAPQGARGLKATPGANAGEITLTWQRSKDA